MNLTDELRKLADLHKEGQLTDQEFADGKKRLLGQAGDESAAPSKNEKTVADAAVRIEEKSYKSSRWSSGNLFFPDRLTMADDGMLFRKGAMFGSSEELINYRAVASVRIKNGIFLAELCIETSGGSQPIFVNGLWKSDAKEIQDTIRACQNRG
jgi:hypothetical protein